MEETLARILLVEDQPTLAALRRAVLTREGHEVVCTGDGQRACRLLRHGEGFDLVITDAVLPKGSGLEVAMAAKEFQLPVILTTGWPSENVHQVADWVSPKPSSLRKFLSLVDSALKKSVRPKA